MKIPNNYKIGISVYDEKGEHLGEGKFDASTLNDMSVFHGLNALDEHLGMVWDQYVENLPANEKKRIEALAERDKYVFFWKSISPFSNFHIAPVHFKGVDFNCSEQAFMYQKALFFNDTSTAEKILKEKEPKKQKQLGREVALFNKEAWNDVSFQVMYEVCFEKFRQNEGLKKVLLLTIGKELVKASPEDLRYGIGLTEDNPLIYQKSNWLGMNLLGQALDAVREDLIAGKTEPTKQRFEC